MSRRHLPTKPAKHYTTAEHLHMRRVKRKLGPSAIRRADARHKRFVHACGCIAAQHGLILCKEHAPWVAPPSGEPIVEEVAAMVQALEAARKCDGNHGGLRCVDPECWNDEAFATEQTAIDAEATLNDVL